MSAATLEAPPRPAPIPGFRLFHVTIDRYYRMIEKGVFKANDSVILWKGSLVEKMTKGPPHNFAVTEIHGALFRLMPAAFFVRQEQPILLDDDTVPEPDCMVVRGASRDYSSRIPSASDVVLLVEIADSSLAIDSGEVLETYARNAIPCYWIVNLPDRRIEVYSKPEGASFTVKEFFGPDDAVPVILDGREVGRVAVRDVLP